MPIHPDLIPAWMKPENASVTDDTMTTIARAIAHLMGADTATGQLQAAMPMGLDVPNPAGEGGIAGLVQKYLKAYHGSPHDFEQFSTAKIGTGEGAQAYGHGLYFAENPAVADEYKRALGSRAFKVGDRELVSPMGGSTRALDTQTRGENIAAQALDDAINAQSTSPGQYAANQVRKGTQYGEDPAHIQAALDVIHEWQKTGEVHKMAGKTYEVAIKADPEHFLDWDKPLSQQSEKVKAALGSDLQREEFVAQAGKRLVDYSGDTLLGIKLQGELRKNGGNIHAALDTLAGLGNDTWKAKVAGAKQLDWSGLTSQMVESPGRGQDLVSDYVRRMGGPDKASAYLKEKGIPGIKYLDQGSRSAGEGSRNYVVFDDKLIEVLRKYGLLPPLAGGAYQQANQQRAQ